MFAAFSGNKKIGGGIGFVFKEMRKKNRVTQHLSGCIGSQEVCDKPEGIFSIQSAVPFHHTYRLFYKTVIRTKESS